MTTPATAAKGAAQSDPSPPPVQQPEAEVPIEETAKAPYEQSEDLPAPEQLAPEESHDGGELVPIARWADQILGLGPHRDPDALPPRRWTELERRARRNEIEALTSRLLERGAALGNALAAIDSRWKAEVAAEESFRLRVEAQAAMHGIAERIVALSREATAQAEAFSRRALLFRLGMNAPSDLRSQLVNASPAALRAYAHELATAEAGTEGEWNRIRALGGLLHHTLLNRAEHLPPVVRNEIQAALTRVPLDTPERTAWLEDLKAMRDAGPQALLAVDELILGHSDPHKRLAAERVRRRPITEE